MKVFMVGGTGLIGSEAARLLTGQGHTVTGIALPPLPAHFVQPAGMTLALGDVNAMSDEEILSQMQGCEGFVFAAGVDERVEAKAPVYALYRQNNIDPLVRLLALCRQSGIGKAVVCGSYFAHFARKMPQLRLSETHPYIRSRLEQEEEALAFAGDDLSVAVLQLPYIFGTQRGRKPVWMFLAEMILNAKQTVYYPKGGSTMVTLRQVGEAVCGALLRTRGGVRYPVGWFNLDWDEMLGIMMRALDCPEKKVRHVPPLLFTLGVRRVWKEQRARDIEGGLYLPKLADIQCNTFFIDKEEGSLALGVTEDDIAAAIEDSMRLCADVLAGRADVLDMRGSDEAERDRTGI